MATSLDAMFPAHFEALTERFDRALEHAGFDAVVIGSGVTQYRFRDDQSYPFVMNPYLVPWVPVHAHPGSGLIYRPGQTPRLVLVSAVDYWHAPAAAPGAPWSQVMAIDTVSSADEAEREFAAQPARVARLGPAEQWPAGAAHVNPKALTDFLDYHRPYKSAYERGCIARANRAAARAHLAVASAFAAGASEFEMLLEFLRACRATPDELPYPAIIATNRNCATLHYQHYARERGELHSLLIDAGCSCNGYAADVSRSHAFDNDRYAAMIADLDREQQALSAAVRPGMNFVDLHRQAHLAVARLLVEWDLAQGNPQTLFEAGVTRAFFPHGLGHYLGQQVHELGGLLADKNGNTLERPAEFPHLRTLRTLEAGQVLTIEPGVYFIDSLLNELRNSPGSRLVNWARVEAVHAFGGMRIEDNVVVTPGGSDNLTRRAFADPSA